MLNKIILQGRLTNDPETRKTQDGTSVTRFSIAVNRTFDREAADFFTVVAWRGTADNCAKFLQKGSPVLVCGSMQMSNFEDKNGNKRTSYSVQAQEVSFLGGGNSGGNEEGGRAKSSKNSKKAAKKPAYQEPDDEPMDDDDEGEFPW